MFEIDDDGFFDRFDCRIVRFVRRRGADEEFERSFAADGPNVRARPILLAGQIRRRHDVTWAWRQRVRIRPAFALGRLLPGPSTVAGVPEIEIALPRDADHDIALDENRPGIDVFDSRHDRAAADAAMPARLPSRP